MIIESKCEKDTFELGKKIGREAAPGDVYTLVGDLGVGTVALLYVVLVLRSLLQQSSGIACSMVSFQGLAAYGVGAAVLMGLALLYWRELGHREEQQDDR